MRKNKDYGIIVAAAVFYENKVYSIPQPARHNDILKMISEERIKAGLDMYVRNEEQGFLTSLGKFVRRKPAGIIAVQSGQIKELKWPPLLYSEDLW